MADSVSTDAAHSDDIPLSLSLSGGGKRAAVFSLGALLALVNSGEHARIKTISSVSGGSTTNLVTGATPNLL